MVTIFLAEIKALANNALGGVFGNTYPEVDFRNITVSVEFPESSTSYPGIWTDFRPNPVISSAGVGHTEYTQPDATTGAVAKVRHWQGSGTVTYTVVSLTSLQRDRLHDAVVTVLAFGAESDLSNQYRTKIEQSELIPLTMQWDTLSLGGYAATPGTPWDTMDVIYEATISINCLFEFYSDPSGVLLPVSGFNVVAYPYTGVDPTTPGGWI